MPEKRRKVIKKIVRPGKNIVASMADDFRIRLERMVTLGIKDLTIDLKGVGMVDSVGLGLLIAAYNSINDKGGTMKIKNASGEIYNLLKVMRLDQHFEVTAAEY